MIPSQGETRDKRLLVGRSAPSLATSSPLSISGGRSVPDQEPKTRRRAIYAKVFASLWQGTLCGQAHPQLVFVYLLAHADREGFVDIHPRRIATDCGLAIEQVRAALDVLEAADPESRTPDHDGARIERVDEHRAWGWKIVNYVHYRMLKDADTIRLQTRERVAKHRLNNPPKRKVTQGNAQKRHADVDVEGEVDAEAEAGRKTSPEPQGVRDSAPVVVLPVIEKGKEFTVTEAAVGEMQALYVGVDVRREVLLMRGWLLANPKNLKTLRGVPRFMNAWLARAQNNSRPAAGRSDRGLSASEIMAIADRMGEEDGNGAS